MDCACYWQYSIRTRVQVTQPCKVVNEEMVFFVMQTIVEGRSWWINIQNLHPYEEGADILDVSICQIYRHVINKLTNFDFTANRVGRCVEKIRIQARGFKVAQFNTKFWIHAFFSLFISSELITNMCVICFFVSCNAYIRLQWMFCATPIRSLSFRRPSGVVKTKCCLCYLKKWRKSH